jgi:MFS family permease
MTDEPAESTEGTEAIEIVPLSKNRNFRLLWIGQVLSDLGSALGALAYPLLILALTHSPLIAGVVGTVTSGAAFLVRLPAGALADRLDRRRTMIIVDAVRGVVLAGLALAVALNSISWPVVLVVAIVDRVGDTIFTPSATAALPIIVHDNQLEAAWAATEARQFTAQLGGPALGGILFSVGRAIPFLGDTISYGISALTSFGMKGKFHPAPHEGERPGLWMESFEGIRFLWHDALLRAIIIQAPLINFAFSGAIFTVILGLQRNGTPADVIGLTQAGLMVGGLLGALVAPKIQGRLSLTRLVLLLTAGGTVFFAIGALIMPSPWVALPLTIPLFLSPTTNAALFAALFRRTPEGMRGRVNNALLQMATGLAALAPLVAGIIVEKVSSNWAMGAFAIALGISAVMTLNLKGLAEAELAA